MPHGLSKVVDEWVDPLVVAVAVEAVAAVAVSTVALPMVEAMAEVVVVDTIQDQTSSYHQALVHSTHPSTIPSTRRSMHHVHRE